MKRKLSFVNRPPILTDDPHWYKDAIIYELRTRSYYDSNGDGVGDFQGLTTKLDYLQDLGVTAIWLLPFYPSPGRDDGYDISDYTDVHAELGSLADFELVLREAHRRGIRVITELVLNHTSDQHPWFQRARRAPPGSPERDFYVWSDSPERYRDARIIFKDFEPSNWSWDRVANAYYWHRFYAHQPDLNYQNPAVPEAMIKVVDFWLERGVDGLRLDAVPYLYEEEGTNCENLPKTHEFLRKLRAHVDAKFKNRMLLAEANQWPEDAAAYFGQGDECHMNFHFPIMPRMFMAIHMEDRLPIIDILAQTPKLDATSQWALFLRNHDELTLEMVTDDERDYMYKAYAHEAAMRINLGIRRRLAPLVGNDRRKMELLNGLLFSLPGTPVVYYGDEIGMGDNIFLGDRNGVRTPMQWSSDRNAGFSRANPQRLILPVVIDPEYHYESLNVEAQQSNPSSLLWWTKRLIALRKRYQAFGRGTIDFLNPSNPHVLAFVREYGEEIILVVANLSRYVQYVELDLSRLRGLAPVELFGRTQFPPIGELPYLLTLGGHAFYWFSVERPQVTEDVTRISLYELPTIECTSGKSLLEGEDRPLLETILPTYLESRHWYAGRGKTISAAKVVEVIPFENEALTILFVRVEYAEGEPDTYVLPLAVAGGKGGTELRNVSTGAVVAQLRTAAGFAILFDALDDPARARLLYDLVAAGGHARGTLGELVGTAETPGALAEAEVPGEPRKVGFERSSTTLQLGDRFLLKMYRRMDEGIGPEFEVVRFLSQRAFPSAPKLEGAIEYRRGRAEPITFAILQSYVPNEGTAWDFTVQEIRRFYERVLARNTIEPPPPLEHESPMLLSAHDPPPAVSDMIGGYANAAALLGQRAAELHLTLASSMDDPAFAPEPYTSLNRRSKYQSVRNLSGNVLRQLRAQLARLPEHTLETAHAVLAREQEILRRFEPLLTEKMTSSRIRSHGDFHLSQVLYTGKDFVIIDFDGGGDLSYTGRRRKRSPLRDLADMVRSFHFAAFKVLHDPGAVRENDRDAAQPWAHLWASWVSAGFLRAYLAQTEGAHLIPQGLEHTAILFDAFLLEKALYELRNELEHRSPDVAIPLAGIAHMLQS